MQESNCSCPLWFWMEHLRHNMLANVFRYFVNQQDLPRQSASPKRRPALLACQQFNKQKFPQIVENLIDLVQSSPEVLWRSSRIDSRDNWRLPRNCLRVSWRLPGLEGRRSEVIERWFWDHSELWIHSERGCPEVVLFRWMFHFVAIAFEFMIHTAGDSGEARCYRAPEACV